jgi:RNA polymerase sigma-54 factor
MVRDLIAAEDPRSPLSDDRIAAILTEKGIKIARRTVAKYRIAQNIPGAIERRAATLGT